MKQAERASEVAELAAVRAQQVRAAAEKKQGGVGGIIAGITALLVIGGGGAVLLNGDGPSLDVPAPNIIKIQKRSEPSPLASQTQEARSFAISKRWKRWRNSTPVKWTPLICTIRCAANR